MAPLTPLTNIIPNGKKKKELTDHERIEAMGQLLGMASFGELPKGSYGKVAVKFEVRPRTIRRLWLTANKTREQGKIDETEVLSKSNQRGINSKRWNEYDILEAVKAIHWRKRPTWEQLADQLGMPETSLRRLKGKGLFKHTSPLKPFLTDQHMIARVDHCLSKVNPDNQLVYGNLYNEVHVDEKWFNLTEDGQTFVLCEGEEPPKRKVQHKSYIAKIMFLCAQARPRIVNGSMWDGKVGLWPIGYMDVATRSSANRPQGTPVWKNESVNRDKYREMMIDDVLPAILAKFPEAYLSRKGVLIQQDGARSHIEPTDEEWLEAVENTGCKIKLVTQAAQSPDLNINDLAFFRSIMSLKRREAPKNELELIAAVKKAHEEYPASKINRMWITLMTVMNQIIATDGGNDFKIPHMNKDQLEREGRLPVTIQVTPMAGNYFNVDEGDEVPENLE